MGRLLDTPLGPSWDVDLQENSSPASRRLPGPQWAGLATWSEDQILRRRLRGCRGAAPGRPLALRQQRRPRALALLLRRWRNVIFRDVDGRKRRVIRRQNLTRVYSGLGVGPCGSGGGGAEAGMLRAEGTAGMARRRRLCGGWCGAGAEAREGVRAGPRATVGAARALPKEEPGIPGLDPRVGMGARRGMAAGWTSQGSLHGPGAIHMPGCGGSKVCGDFEHPTFLAAHVYTQVKELVQVEAWRVGGPFLGTGVRIQLAMHLPSFDVLPWFITGLTLTLKALCVQFPTARPVWLSWSCLFSKPSPPAMHLQPENPRSTAFCSMA